MVADYDRGLAGWQRIAGNDNVRSVGCGEDALDVRPHRGRDHGGGIVYRGLGEQREGQQQRQQSVGDGQVQQPGQQMQGGAEQLAQALEALKLQYCEWHADGSSVSHGGGATVRSTAKQ